MTEERIRELARKAHLTPADVCAGIIRTAIAETREECALACELVEAEEWDRYKYGEPEYRADPYREGMSDGAGKCAAAIRAKG